MSHDLFNGWLETITSAPPGVLLYQERAGQREIGLRLLKALAADHFVGEATILKAGGYKKAADVILNSLPTSKRVRSGDLAELLATEYVNSETSFRVPIKKLRWKSDRQMPMHGNDIIGVDTTANPTKILKVVGTSSRPRWIGAEAGSGPGGAAELLGMKSSTLFSRMSVLGLRQKNA